jgi:hypothetical protein
MSPADPARVLGPTDGRSAALCDGAQAGDPALLSSLSPTVCGPTRKCIYHAAVERHRARSGWWRLPGRRRRSSPRE